MIFQKNNDLIHFIHIPRTGGRWTSALLKQSNYEPVIFGQEFWGGIQTHHLSYLEAKEYYLKKNWTEKSFAVVRDPITRFESAFQLFLDFTLIENYNVLEDYDYFCWVMNDKPMITWVEGNHNKNYRYQINGLINAHNGMWRPQFDYISFDTKIWKYENGLNEIFSDWLKEEVNLDIIENTSHQVQYKNTYFDNKKYKLSDKIKDNIFNYYKPDYKRFYTNLL